MRIKSVVQVTRRQRKKCRRKIWANTRSDPCPVTKRDGSKATTTTEGIRNRATYNDCESCDYPQQDPITKEDRWTRTSTYQNERHWFQREIQILKKKAQQYRKRYQRLMVVFLYPQAKCNSELRNERVSQKLHRRQLFWAEDIVSQLEDVEG